MKRLLSLVLMVSAPSCGGGDPVGPTPVPTPTPDTRTTETRSTVAILYPDGGMGYPEGSPSVTIGGAGLVEATASFTPVVVCQFVFVMCRGNCRFSDLTSTSGPGPSLSVQGNLSPGTYALLLGANTGSCGPVPSRGVQQPYTVTVKHP